ncbi:hypothetical protein AWB92_07950 [Mycobacterium sp. IEC1808]|nr:hypothetical protein A5712_25035 [Mycobacterium sp. E2327]ORW96152.1 hypothetical protein AWB92_07950 [Mycobacterium sp. IEC1808]
MRKLIMLLSGVVRIPFAPRRNTAGPTVGVGTVRTVGDERQVFIEVVAVSGETFIGKLARCDGDADVSMLRPGLVVLVAFDPAAREELSLPDDVVAVNASWLASI